MSISLDIDNKLHDSRFRKFRTRKRIFKILRERREEKVHHLHRNTIRIPQIIKNEVYLRVLVYGQKQREVAKSLKISYVAVGTIIYNKKH